MYHTYVCVVFARFDYTGRRDVHIRNELTRATVEVSLLFAGKRLLNGRGAQNRRG